MKKRNLINIVVIVLFSLFWSCAKDEMPEKPQPSPFSVSAEGDNLTVPVSGGIINVNVKAGSDGWWIVVPTTEKTWCVVTKIYGSGDYKLPVTFKPNTTGAVRTVSVTFNPTFGLAASNMTFTQNAN